MSLFQCQVCGCVENTALSFQGFQGVEEWFDWTGIEERRGKLVCSACGPSRSAEGDETGYGKWHGQFERRYLPLGQFKTASDGNLEHIATGSQNYKDYLLTPEDISVEVI